MYFRIGSEFRVLLCSEHSPTISLLFAVHSTHSKTVWSKPCFSLSFILHTPRTCKKLYSAFICALKSTLWISYFGQLCSFFVTIDRSTVIHLFWSWHSPIQWHILKTFFDRFLPEGNIYNQDGRFYRQFSKLWKGASVRAFRVLPYQHSRKSYEQMCIVWCIQL